MHMYVNTCNLNLYAVHNKRKHMVTVWPLVISLNDFSCSHFPENVFFSLCVFALRPDLTVAKADLKTQIFSASPSHILRLEVSACHSVQFPVHTMISVSFYSYIKFCSVYFLYLSKIFYIFLINIFFIHSPIHEHLGLFHFLPIVSNAALNMDKQVSLGCIDIKIFGYIPKSWDTYLVTLTLGFLRSLHYFHSCCISIPPTVNNTLDKYHVNMDDREDTYAGWW